MPYTVTDLKKEGEYVPYLLKTKTALKWLIPQLRHDYVDIYLLDLVSRDVLYFEPALGFFWLNIPEF